MDTNEDKAIFIHFNKDKAYRFNACGNGLYYFDISAPKTISLTAKDTVEEYLKKL